ncbi:hypothetical protein ACQY0O_002796 [Thecaphora frezii]
MSTHSTRSSAVLFSHPAAHLVKTVPSFHPPNRINGHVPIDAIGASNHAASDVVLATYQGPLDVSVVPDPFHPHLSTLVLSVGFDERQWGAARRFILPFRTFSNHDGAGSSDHGGDDQHRHHLHHHGATHPPDVARSPDHFHTGPRDIYEGLGAGLQGTDGGSFWFYEDVTEEGACDRQKWEADGVGRRAIWTVWILAAPAPVVCYARELLQNYPAPVQELPPFLRGDKAFPWKDAYLALPADQAQQQQNLQQPAQQLQQLLHEAKGQDAAASASNAVRGPRPLPPLPPLPRKPEMLRSLSFPRRQLHLSEVSSPTSPVSPSEPASAAALEATADAGAQTLFTEKPSAIKEDEEQQRTESPSDALAQAGAEEREDEAGPEAGSERSDDGGKTEAKEAIPVEDAVAAEAAVAPEAVVAASEKIKETDTIANEGDETDVARTEPAKAKVVEADGPVDGSVAEAETLPADAVPEATAALELPAEVLPPPKLEEDDAPLAPAKAVEAAAPTAEPPASATLRNLSRRLPPRMPDYRHSLVAVDNETGQIVGVLASDVHLDTATPPLSTSSSDDDAEEDGYEEVATPLDAPIVPEKDSLGSYEQPEADLTTPRASTFLPPRTAAALVDLAEDTKGQRASMLGDDTFSPPPPPPKTVRAAQPGDALPSTRTSVASAAVFFSAAEDRSGDEASDRDDDDDDDGDRRGARANRDVLGDFVDIPNYQIESHRPDLLRDLGRHGDGNGGDDDDARSDVSGTTIGGPAVKAWRKVRGKPPKKKRVAAAAAQPEAADQGRAVAADAGLRASRAGSMVSFRTSRAETAAEGFTDAESSHEDDDSEEPVEADERSEVQDVSDHSAAAKDEDKDADEADEMVEDPAELVQQARALGHCSRLQMRTEDVRTIEDRVWREALEAGDLPFDAPYTHLAARGLFGTKRRGQAQLAPQEFELRTTGESARMGDAVTTKSGGRPRAAAAANNGYMQGGTVLIDFLAGSSRIGASLIRGSPYEGSTVDGRDTADSMVANADSAATAEAGAGGVLRMVPLLPQHLLRFFGMSATAAPLPAASTATVAATPLSSSLVNALPSLSGVASLWSDATGWMGSFFSSSSTGTPGASPDAAAVAGEEASRPRRDSDADEWEYAIPDFDPNSLASTPRPVYRRKRPIPSAIHGFNMPGSQPSKSAEPQPQQPSTEAKREASTYDGAPSRYSILHIDSFGIGRKAFLRGLPEYGGM